MLPVIEKELLHYEILNAMDRARLLEHLSFQGGTCLRLCYSSERYSEDLDFAGGTDFLPSTMRDLRKILIEALSRRYLAQVEVVEPSVTAREVFSWQLRIVTAPRRKDLPMQRISVEVARIDAHTRAVLPLKVNYAGLPPSYGNILMICESLEEICADKLKAFITAPHIRYRDLWDLRWIARQAGFDREPLADLLSQKLDDYQAGKLFLQNLPRLQDLATIVDSPEFIGQMRRFLPTEAVADTLERELFREHLVDEVKGLYRTAGAI